MHCGAAGAGGHLPREENIGVPAGDLARSWQWALDCRVVLFSNRARAAVVLARACTVRAGGPYRGAPASNETKW